MIVAFKSIYIADAVSEPVRKSWGPAPLPKLHELKLMAKPRQIIETPNSYERDAKAILDNLIEAVQDGRVHKINTRFDTPGDPPNIVEAVSLWGLDMLGAYDLWPEALRLIAGIEKTHPKARQRFVYFWQCSGWMLRGIVDDDTLFAALRNLLPRYAGGPTTLYRGQAAGQWVGPSWSDSYQDALLFARGALAFDQPIAGVPRVQRLLWPVKKAAIIRANLHHEIISGPLKAFQGDVIKDTEHVIDPRGVNYEIVETIDAQIKRGGAA